MKRAILVAVAAMVSVPAFGLALQFDFSTSAGSYGGKIAPGYEASAEEPNAYGAAGTTITNAGGMGLLDSRNGTAWNVLGSGGMFSGLMCVDGTSAGSDVKATLAAGSPSDGMGNWSGSVQTWTESASTSGVQSTSLMLDVLYTTNNLLGFRITGLPVGTYAVIVMDVTPNVTSTRPHEFKAGLFTDASQGSYNDEALSVLGTLNAHGLTDAPLWTNGVNYLMTTITTTSESDYIVVMGTGFNASMNGIQIIQMVPEPATMGLLALGGLALLRRRR